MDKLLPCPFCNASLVRRGEWGIYDHKRVGCILDGSSITTDNLDEWNTRHTPEGWQLVPVEATEIMQDEGLIDMPTPDAHPYDCGMIYKAMLAAAPKWGGE